MSKCKADKHLGGQKLLNATREEWLLVGLALCIFFKFFSANVKFLFTSGDEDIYVVQNQIVLLDSKLCGRLHRQVIFMGVLFG